MNVTLDTYIKRADEICSNKKNTKNKNELKGMIRYLEDTLKTLQKKYNSTFEEKPEKKHLINNVTNIHLSSFPGNIKHGKLYWIEDINQYCLKIDKLILRGNLATIFDKKLIINNKINTHQIVVCSKGNTCDEILSEKYCKFYHDPLDLYQLMSDKKISQEYYEKHVKNFTRNFSSTSWLYSHDLVNSKNKNMRRIGSKSTLYNDIKIAKILKKQEFNTMIEDMKQQVMHDLLVLLILMDENLG